MAHMEERVNTFGVFEGKSEGQRLHGRLRCIKKDDIKMKWINDILSVFKKVTEETLKITDELLFLTPAIRYTLKSLI